MIPVAIPSAAFISGFVSWFENSIVSALANCKSSMMTKENQDEKHRERSTDERKRKLIETAQTDPDLCTVDHSGAARTALSVRWEYEADRADPNADGTDAAAGPVSAVHRRSRGSRGDRSDPAWSLAHSTDPDPAGCLWAPDHHDRGDGGYPGRR